MKKLRDRYLAELAKETRNLPWGSVDPEQADATCSGTDRQSLGLIDVYTALDTTEIDRPETEDQVRLFLSRWEEQKRVSAQEMANRETRLVLLGDPGSGKSTMVNFLAHVLARAGLNKGTGEWAERLDPWEHGVLLPVRIVLRDFTAWIGKAENGSADLLREYLKTQFEKSEFAGFWDAFYEGLLNASEPYLILLDGLDEVPSELRKVVVETIHDFSAKYSGHRYLITCRIYAYIGHAYQIAGFKQATLMPFDADQINRFISVWYDQLWRRGRFSKIDADERAGQLQEAAKRPDLSGLAERPLLLTSMAVLHTFKGQLPNDRVELYQGTIDLLFRRWQTKVRDEQGLLDALNIPGLKMTNLESAMYNVAFHAHAGQTGGGETADIAEETILRHLKPYIGSYDKAEIFMAYVRERAGLLISHKPETYTFPHRTFQEFMAACHLVEHREYPSESARLVTADPDRWRMVYVLAARHASRGQGMLSVTALCNLSVEEAGAKDAVAYRRAAIAAEALIEIGRMEAEQDDFGKGVLNRVRNWMLSAMRADDVLEPKERVEMGNLLAELGDPRFDPDNYYLPVGEDLGFVKIPAGPFMMGTREEDIPELEKHFGLYKPLEEYEAKTIEVFTKQFG